MNYLKLSRLYKREHVDHAPRTTEPDRIDRGSWEGCIVWQQTTGLPWTEDCVKGIEVLQARKNEKANETVTTFALLP